MNRSHLLLSFALFFVTATAVRADEIDDAVRRWIEQQHVPAASIAVIKEGSLIKAEGYGFADLEHGRPDRYRF